MAFTLYSSDDTLDPPVGRPCLYPWEHPCHPHLGYPLCPQAGTLTTHSKYPFVVRQMFERRRGAETSDGQLMLMPEWAPFTS